MCSVVLKGNSDHLNMCFNKYNLERPKKFFLNATTDAREILKVTFFKAI